MAQTTAAMSAKDMYVAFGTNGTVWTEASGYAVAVEVDGGDRAIGEAYTFDGDYPIIKAGKRAGITVKVRGVYTETATHLFTIAKTAYEAGSAFYVRWSPGGGDAGDLGYTTPSGIVTNCLYPEGASDSADPILFEVDVVVPYVTVAAIGTAGW